jgi:6-phosphogluconolactonase/glucosamine-6-phosphate isomerase/deaminase
VFKVIQVKNPNEGVEACKKLLYEMVSKSSVLFLSGGSTPKTLYEILAKEGKLNAGAVAMVDERFGAKLHENSNEKMIEDTSIISYLEENKKRFYPILENKEIEETTRDYDETVRFLFNYFQKSVAILGVGTDGHTAGLPAGVQSKVQNKTDLVTSFADFPGDFKERITLTFLGLSKLDQIIVLVFGRDKKKALELMFKEGSIEEIPARFLVQKEISGKVTLITDQTIK